MKEYWQNYIDGQFIDGGAGKIQVDDPGTGQKLADQALASNKDVDRAVEAATKVHKSCFLTDMRPVERARMVKKIGEYLLEKADEIAPILSREAGKTLFEARLEVTNAARYFEYYGNQAETLEGRSIPLGSTYYDFTTYEPYGISAQVIPWNFPMEMTARSLSTGLTTGNTCVIKTPELTPLTQYYYAGAVEFAGFPPGTVNILCGIGNQAGEYLCSHPGVRQIAFTGSVKTGSAIATAAAKNIVPTVLELGGKSAGIVCEDASLSNLSENIRKGIFFNAGQVCSAMSRLVVHEKIYDDVVELSQDIAKKMSVGPGIERSEFAHNMGAMISLKQRDRAVSICDQAQKQGAKAVTGGRPLNNEGFFLEPTVFSNVEQSMEIAHTEIFGPVLSILKYKTEKEAIDIANGTEYGLVGGVFTQDLDKAMFCSQKIKAGQIFVNEWFAGGVETPFGGYGKSGYGREKGREALLNYVQTKNIAIKLGHN